MFKVFLSKIAMAEMIQIFTFTQSKNFNFE